MATTTISPKFQIVIPKEVREKLRLTPKQRLQVLEKGGVITLVPEVPLKSLRGLLKGMSKSDLREKKDRSRRSLWIRAAGSSFSKVDCWHRDILHICPILMSL